MKIVWTRTAIRDLVGIRRYIGHDNPMAARDVASRILVAVGVGKGVGSLFGIPRSVKLALIETLRRAAQGDRLLHVMLNPSVVALNPPPMSF